ncbi:hypothetical protein PTKIN_Ptkin15bG0172900 [Pterospermum kingtungense]
MSTPPDWPPFYQNLSNQDVSNRSLLFGDHHQGSEAATSVVSTTTTSNNIISGSSSLGSVPAASSSGGGGGGGGHLSPEGRVGKPVRRRTRASRRTPTTLLNTDTTNFRAMVQQFTGSPTAPFPTSAHPGGPNIGFSFGGRQALLNPAGSLMVPPAGGFHLQYQHHHHQQQQQQQPQFQHQHQPYMFPLNNNINNPSGAGDLFFQRLGGNPRPNMEAAGSEGFVVEGVSSQIPPRNNFLQ